MNKPMRMMPDFAAALFLVLAVLGCAPPAESVSSKSIVMISNIVFEVEIPSNVVSPEEAILKVKLLNSGQRPIKYYQRQLEIRLYGAHGIMLANDFSRWATLIGVETESTNLLDVMAKDFSQHRQLRLLEPGQSREIQINLNECYGLTNGEYKLSASCAVINSPFNEPLRQSGVTLFADPVTFKISQN